MEVINLLRSTLRYQAGFVPGARDNVVSLELPSSYQTFRQGDGKGLKFFHFPTTAQSAASIDELHCPRAPRMEEDLLRIQKPHLQK